MRKSKSFDFLDKTVKPVLERSIKQNKEIYNEVRRIKRELFYGHNKLITSRRILAIIYSNVAAQDSVIKTDYVLKLTNLPWKGDKDWQAEAFHDEAAELLYKVEYNVGEEGKKNAIYFKMKMETDISKDRLI